MAWYDNLFSGGMDTATQTSTVPDWMQPYLANYMQTSQNVANLPYNPYQGQTVADLNPYQVQGLNAQAQRAVNGSPVMDAASAELQRTSSGGYLNDPAATNAMMYSRNLDMGSNPFATANNPYLSQMIDSASGDVTRNYMQSVIPQLTALDARSGSFGNSGVANATSEAQGQLARALGDVSGNLRFQDYGQRANLAENLANRQYQSGESFANRLFSGGESQAARDQAQYQNERSRMMGGLSLAPTYANQDYTDAAALQAAGQGFQQNQQANLTDQYNRYQQAQNYPYKQLEVLGQGVGLGANTGRTTTTQTPGTSPLATGLGTAAGLYSLGGSTSPTVICTELHRQGFMSNKVFALDQAYGFDLARKHPEVYAGYIRLATPVVGRMKRSPRFSRFVWMLAKPWADEMAHQMGHGKGSIIGSLIMAIGYPLCKSVGSRIGRMDQSVREVK